MIPGLFGVQKMAAYRNNTVYLAGSFRGEASVGGHYIYSLAEEIFLFKITAYGTYLSFPGHLMILELGQ